MSGPESALLGFVGGGLLLLWLATMAYRLGQARAARELEEELERERARSRARWNVAAPSGAAETKTKTETTKGR